MTATVLPSILLQSLSIRYDKKAVVTLKNNDNRTETFMYYPTCKQEMTASVWPTILLMTNQNQQGITNEKQPVFYK